MTKLLYHPLIVKQKIKVAIADDHHVVLSGIQNMLQPYAHIDLCARYRNGLDLLKGLEDGPMPDVLLLDIQMPDKNGDELAGIISRKYPALRMLALTGFDTPFYIRSMMQQGCKGYLLKNTDQDTLIEAIETVYNNGQYIEERLKDQLLQNMLRVKKQSTQTAPVLTQREKDILRLIVAELTSQQIADRLFLSLRTVEKYRLNILQKLQVKNTAGLVKAALELGLAE